MIWFSIKKLEKQISSDELTEKDGFNYLLAYFVSTILIISLFSHSSSAFGWIKILTGATQVIITIIGLRAVYNVNLEIDGKDFLKRFLAYNWVFTCRFILITLILCIVLGILIGIFLGGAFPTQNSDTSSIIVFIAGILLNVIWYLLMVNSFRKLKHK